jgi:ADP-ribose diphosphatase
MKLPPEILNRKIAAQTAVFTVEEQELRFANGNTVLYERLVSSSRGAVLIVPLLDDDTVLLIREYAAGVQRYELALPKGSVDANETPLEAANREMMEEIGYGARQVQHIKSLSASPGYLDHMTHVIVARDLYENKLPGDEPEPIEVVPYSLNRFEELFQREDFTEARTIAALYMVREYYLLR